MTFAGDGMNLTQTLTDLTKHVVEHAFGQTCEVRQWRARHPLHQYVVAVNPFVIRIKGNDLRHWRISLLTQE